MSSLEIFVWFESQSPRAWFAKFNQTLETFGMQKSKSYHYVFYKNFSSSISLLVVYVDDIVITGSDYKGILSLKSFLHNQFHTKDLEILKYFLGVKFMRSKQGIMLSQWKYILDMLSETGKLGVKPCSTPMALNVQLTKERELFGDLERYQKTRLEIELSYSNSPEYCSFCKCVESVYVIFNTQSLGICKAYPMLLERSP